MIFERFDDRGLSQYSYAVGCRRAGAIAIVDPRRDVDVYLDYAAREGVAIRWVLETHIHADFASGARELAARTGAALRLSAYDEGERYEVRFAHTPVADGEALDIGTTRLVARHTPGHTPEHLSYLVFDTARSASVPLLMLTGDFLFVGSVGRPDLLGDEASPALAARLYDSLRTVLADLPDGLEIHPGHGAGSMCGSGLGERPMTTLGFERVTNPYLRADLSREAFVARVLADLPPRPPYYFRMKALNAAGPPLLWHLPGDRRLPPAEVMTRVEAGALVIDLRDAHAFAAGHIPGALGMPAVTQVSTWAGWVVPADRPIVLVAPDEATAEEAVRALVRVGLDRVEGRLDGGMEGWTAAGYPVARLAMMQPLELQARLARGERLHVLDVRSAAEWRAGHVPRATHLMYGELPARIDELPWRAEPVAVICGAGHRATLAASLLRRAGFEQVSVVAGGMAEWTLVGLPVETA
ncbi:MAG TPA: rhodanese-like domain-containing protein [Vicinamibacterales bacterium]|nr:rhodanese-like domain-containing protein [Vicinamibacterales bacterium]